MRWSERLPLSEQGWETPIQSVKQGTAERKEGLLGRHLVPPWRAGSVSAPASKLLCESVSHISKSFHRSSRVFLICRG